MNKTQKVRATVEDISFDTTLDKLPAQFNKLVKQLEEEESLVSAHDVVVTSGNATLFIQLEVLGKKSKTKPRIDSLFGYKTEEFMAKQYN